MTDGALIACTRALLVGSAPCPEGPPDLHVAASALVDRLERSGRIELAVRSLLAAEAFAAAPTGLSHTDPPCAACAESGIRDAAVMRARDVLRAVRRPRVRAARHAPLHAPLGERARLGTACTEGGVMAYVIRYAGTVPSYFARFTSPVALPMFGATLAETPRYATEQEAWAVLGAMPMMASAMCEIADEGHAAAKDARRKRRTKRRAG
jgi:hypothetical protein